ncbi:1,2-phenylacetyl-CoA epoxidase subunit PaaE [Enterovirga aerilata]|uniref:Phenylacetate-CoA oxygenase/reductase subunit PaaK n=1 Tax=Enterovirga aerilata TaxID=2730920 RepID=A0A849HW06_9HYPH|nr:1,2-phenylacetyl-CoA epoxidase subunit PaaE [Enterovirga sp. DB1703]NNM71726.1 phenylacetate-CoA oxygenase/reductase subunit PaaK [Enterovirga sp. DB1703]
MTPPRFHRLTIREVRRETPEAVSIAFDIPPELEPDYAWEPGQYLTLRTTLDGEEVRRSYSICSGPEEGELRIGVKRVENGVFSSFANEALRPGHAIDVMTPTGRFGQIAPAAEGRTYAGFAAGSGITPILSIVRGILAREPESRFFLFYGNRSMTDMLFRTALEELKDRYLGRFSVFHVLSQEEQDIPVLNGRLDAEKTKLLLTHLVPAAAVDHVFICGPLGMSEAVEEACRELGLPPDRIHVERFVSEFGGRAHPKPPAPAPDAPSRTASLIVDGKRRDVPVRDGETVLEAALRAGMDLPYACKGGMCSTCRAKVVEGEVAMDLNYSLEPWETQAGFVLTCQSHPKTDRVVIDYDQM